MMPKPASALAQGLAGLPHATKHQVLSLKPGPGHCAVVAVLLAADNPKFQAVYRNISADGAKLVLLLRLSPLVPFSLLNYGLGKAAQASAQHASCSRCWHTALQLDQPAPHCSQGMLHCTSMRLTTRPLLLCCCWFRAGITQVRFLDYAWASWLGMLPGTFAYVYLGSLGKVAADAAGDGAAGDGSFGAAKLALYGEGAGGPWDMGTGAACAQAGIVCLVVWYCH